MEVLKKKTIGKVKKYKNKLEKELNVIINIKDKNISFRGNELDCFIAKKVIRALERNFSIKEALLLTEQDMVLEDISIKKFTTRKDLKKVKARIIGKDAKIIKTINDLADCKITLHDNTVSVLGPAEKMKDSMTAIKKLIKGSSPSKVYAYLERMRREAKNIPQDIGMKESFEKRMKKNTKVKNKD